MAEGRHPHPLAPSEGLIELDAFADKRRSTNFIEKPGSRGDGRVEFSIRSENEARHGKDLL